MKSYEVDIKQTEAGSNQLSCAVFILKIIQSSSLGVWLYPPALLTVRVRVRFPFSNWKKGLASIFLHTVSEGLKEGCETYEREGGEKDFMWLKWNSTCWRKCQVSDSSLRREENGRKITEGDAEGRVERDRMVLDIRRYTLKKNIDR